MSDEVERVLDRWLKDIKAGGDKHKLSLAAVRTLHEVGAPSAITREVSRLAAIAAVDKQIDQVGWSKEQLALLKASRALLVANRPAEEIMPLADMLHDQSGKGHRRAAQT